MSAPAPSPIVAADLLGEKGQGGSGTCHGSPCCRVVSFGRGRERGTFLLRVKPKLTECPYLYFVLIPSDDRRES